MPINEYLRQVKQLYSAGNSTEHSYRPALQNFLLQIVKDITVTNEPKRQRCGAPDYIVQKKEIPLGYIEAKDIGIDLNKTEKDAQITRYLESLSNLILTDYLDFRFFQYGQKVKEIKIASIEKDILIINAENFNSFITYFQDFCQFKGQTITSSYKLAEKMALKAKLMKDVFYNALLEEDENNSLKDQFIAFKQILIHDLDEKTFADVYAQTITYGLFAARLNDPSLESFTRQEARGLIPKSNPFLRNLFDYVSGVQLDERVIWIVDDLADIFRATDLKLVISDFGRSTGQTDPFIHFYETFLAAYDPTLRKSKGVYYTPEPVVNFIVRAVDEILKSEFNLPSGLADISKISINVNDTTNTKKIKKEFHKVQFLDPTTGTGTFLAEIIRQIYKRFEGQEGIWSNYVEEHLIPRLNGFEILMAPYTMCHLKLETMLSETGYIPKDDNKQKRIQVYLTNSLEEAHPDTGTLFASWLSRESIEANYIKRDTPVMVVLGNPPYSVSSNNKGEWIEKLIADYKKDLHERNIQPLADDYIKFIRFGQYYIEKNGIGILAFITNNSFIDGIIHRQMRKGLLYSFDKIYILDLHGNSRIKEKAPDNTSDENVFDIKQGVSVNIFIKTSKKKQNELGFVYHLDVWGKRENKYKLLIESSLSSVKWNLLETKEPNYFFVPKNFNNQDKYTEGFKIDHLFLKNNSGITTHRDDFVYDILLDMLLERLQFFTDLNNSDELISQKFNLKSSSDWDLHQKRKEIIIEKDHRRFIRFVEYRPFDKYFCYYNANALDRPRIDIMKHMYNKNLMLVLSRNCSDIEYRNIFITKFLVDKHLISDQSYAFPLYLYSDDSALVTNRTPNLNMEIVNQIANNFNLEFTNEKEHREGTFAPIDILDYIYAVLHSPTYREKYKEFLKIDFPRVPYPDNAEIFWKLIKFGCELRQIHLLENPIVDHFISKFPIGGDNLVKKVTFDSGKVWINEIQYFDLVPEIAWSFYVGGYQPAQKWLKDRKGRELNFDDICHYQKIIVALVETDRIMKEIDTVVEV